MKEVKKMQMKIFRVYPRFPGDGGKVETKKKDTAAFQEKKEKERKKEGGKRSNLITMESNGDLEERKLKHAKIFCEASRGNNSKKRSTREGGRACVRMRSAAAIACCLLLLLFLGRNPFEAPAAKFEERVVIRFCNHVERKKLRRFHCHRHCIDRGGK